jgi:S-DNA-T family DNA segregation ATPase FtsK/SpoIIIE
MASLPHASRPDAETLVVPFATGSRRLEPASLVLRNGDHVLVTGPARSGKTTALRTLAHVLRRDALAHVVEVNARSGQRTLPSDLEQIAEDLLQRNDPVVLLVDDADLLDDGGALLPLLQSGRPALHVIAAGRPDRFRGLFRHWTNEVRRSRLGLLLRGDELDGDLIGARVPRRSPAPWRPGRGWLVCDDAVELCQVAIPDNNNGKEQGQCA